MIKKIFILCLLVVCAVLAEDISKHPKFHQTANATTIVNPYRYAVVGGGPVAFQGVTTLTDNTGSGSTSISVEAGTELLLLCETGYPPASSPTAHSYNGSSFTEIDLNTVEKPGGGGWVENQQRFWYLQDPATGSNTYTWSGGGTITHGGFLSLIRISGVDTTVGSSGIRGLLAQAQNGRTTITLAPGNATDDLIVSCWNQQVSTTVTLGNGQVFGGTSGTQTIVDSVGYNSDGVYVTTSVPTAASQDVSFLGATGSNYPSGLALSIASD